MSAERGEPTAVIFLDVDGVLNSMWGDEEELKPRCVHQVKRIVQETGAKIVLSSAWRLSPVKVKKLESAGLKIHDKTIDLGGDLTTRAQEILQWVRSHNVESWIVLDDVDLANGQSEAVMNGACVAGVKSEPSLRGHFVLTDLTRRGITAKNAKDAIYLLRSQSGCEDLDASSSEEEQDPDLALPHVAIPKTPRAQMATAQLLQELKRMTSRPKGERAKHFKLTQLRWHPDKNPGDAETSQEVFAYLMELKPWFVGDDPSTAETYVAPPSSGGYRGGGGGPSPARDDNYGSNYAYHPSHSSGSYNNSGQSEGFDSKPKPAWFGQYFSLDGFQPGDLLRIINPVILRRGECLSSEWLADFPPKTKLTVLAVGNHPRLHVSVAHGLGTVEGWLSSHTKEGDALVKRR
ncbi:unnamed protein product [Polarella glacialis]|uniref:J domain-containing protein n=1 Tax=Polarella glacialis TaxID=89957 RepID=A0A813FUC9_POLGL|nr:unnamed protein product [Polarella glacialis]